MGRKPTNGRSDLSLHYSDFVRRLVERENGQAANRWMGAKLPGRSGTYWAEHLVSFRGGPPAPLTTADIALIADAFAIDPYALVAAINDDKLDAVGPLPKKPNLSVVGEPEYQNVRDISPTKLKQPTKKAARTKTGPREDEGLTT